MNGACHYLQTAIGACEACARLFFKSHLADLCKMFVIHSGRGQRPQRMT
jgi:hypothetical protein